MTKPEQKRGTFIHGIAASEHLDSAGERINIEGVDITSLTKDGVLNMEHQSKEASSIVGKIWEAKKILKRSDCESENHKYFWDKIKMPYIYIAGELFDAVGHKEAAEVAAMVRFDQQEALNKDSKKLINFSIEGSRVEKTGSTITKCIARKISITLTPCNKVCEAEEMKVESGEKKADDGKFSFIQDMMSKADEPSCQIMKGENPFIYKAFSSLATNSLVPKAPSAPAAAPKAPKSPGIKPMKIARPDKGFGAIIDKTPKPKPGFGKVIVKAKKTPVVMTAEEAVDEHKKLIDVLESPSHKDDKKEAKKQGKELKEYKEKLDKAEKKINPKDPVLGAQPAEKPPTPEYTAKVTAFLAKPKKIAKATGLPGEFKPKYASHVPRKERRQRRDAMDRAAQSIQHAREDQAAKQKAKESGSLDEKTHKIAKKKLGKYDSNVRKALTASCGMGSSPASKVQGDAVAKSEWIYTTENDFALIRKSKNVREQRKKVFGSKSQPGAGTPMRDKHLNHIKNFVDKFLGLDLQPSGGKIDEKTQQRRSDSPEVGVDKPDWRSGKLESQWNPEAAIHEIAHLMLLPKGISLEDGQRHMDKEYADVQRKYGYMKQKRSQGEVQPMAAEQLIRRFLGMPASQVGVPVKSKDAPQRVSVEDPSKVIATRVQQGQQKSGEPKYIDLIRQARNLHPEHRQRLMDVFSKKIVFDPDQGWIPNKQSLDAAIQNRQPGAVVARQEQRQAEKPPNVVRMKPRMAAPKAPVAPAPAESQDQINPPAMEQMKIAKSEKRPKPEHPKFLDEHKGIIKPSHPDYHKAIAHITATHQAGHRLEARRLHDRYITGGGSYVKKTEIRKVMAALGTQAFERFEKKEELIEFLSQKLPTISDKERMAIAKAVAYIHEKKQEVALKNLLEEEDNG